MNCPPHIKPAYDKERRTHVAVGLDCLGVDRPLVTFDVPTEDGRPKHEANDKTTAAVYCAVCGRDMRYKLGGAS